MKIHAIQDAPADTKPLDLEKFTDELQELSERFGVRLVSIGAMNTTDCGGAYIAIWSPFTEPAEQEN